MISKLIQRRENSCTSIVRNRAVKMYVKMVVKIVVNMCVNMCVKMCVKIVVNSCVKMVVNNDVAGVRENRRENCVNIFSLAI